MVTAVCLPAASKTLVMPIFFPIILFIVSVFIQRCLKCKQMDVSIFN
jgi:hypothetical protein